MCRYSWDYMINHNENEDENENKSHRHDIYRPMSRHRHKYSKYKKCLTMRLCIAIVVLMKLSWSGTSKHLSVQNQQHKKRCEICSTLTIRTPKPR